MNEFTYPEVEIVHDGTRVREVRYFRGRPNDEVVELTKFMNIARVEAVVDAVNPPVLHIILEARLVDVEASS